MSKENKELLVEYIEYLWYAIVCLVSARILQYVGVLPAFELTTWRLVLVGLGTYLGGGLLIDYYEEWLFRSHVMKVAREVAKFQGVDPKKIKYKNVRIIEETEDGIMEVEIDYDGE